MPDDIVTQLDRGRPVTDTELLRRADWIRLQTIDLIRQAGTRPLLVHLLLRRARRHALLPRAAAAPAGAALGGPGPVPARQGPRGDRPVAGPGRPRVLPAGLAQAVRQGRLAAQRPPEHEARARHRLLVRLARPQPVGRRRHGPRGPADRPGLPDLRAHRRRRAAGGPGLGGGDGRQPLQARQPGRDRGRERLLRGRPDVAGDQHRAARQAVRGVRLDGQGDRRERRPRGQVHPRRAARPVERGADRDHRPHPQGARRRVHGEAAAGLAPGPAQRRAVRRRGRRDHRPDGAA